MSEFAPAGRGAREALTVSCKIETRRRRDAILYEDLRPGEYMQLRACEANHAKIWAVMRCASCGVLSSVGREIHSVDYDGEVTPSSVCPNTMCGLGGSLLLADWMPEPKGNA